MSNKVSKTMKVKTDVSVAETTTTVEDLVSFDVSNMPNGITYKGLKAVLSFADPIQWNQQSTYDALTVVWDDATLASYASKRPVPAGIALTNENYWHRMADGDAQIEIYRQEVAQFDQRITNNTNDIATNSGDIASIKNEIKKFENDILIIGDSWSEPYSLRQSKTWTTWLGEYIKGDIHNYARGGATVIGNTPNAGLNGNFLGQVNAAIADDSFNHADIGIIIIEGGINDFRGNKTSSEVTSAFITHINNLHTNFPKARIICVLNHQVLVSKEQWLFMNEIRFSLIKYCECHMTFGWLQYPALYNTEDYVHPSLGINGGAKAILSNMLAIMFGGEINYAVNYNHFMLTDSSGNQFMIDSAAYVDNSRGIIIPINKIQIIKNVNVTSGTVYSCVVDRDGNATSEGWTISSAEYYNIFAIECLTATQGMYPSNVLDRDVSCYFSASPRTTNDAKQITDMTFAFKFKGVTPGTAVNYPLFSYGIMATPYRMLH